MRGKEEKSELANARETVDGAVSALPERDIALATVFSPRLLRLSFRLTDEDEQ